MLVKAPVETCDWHIICFLEGNTLPFQKRPLLSLFEPLHHLPFRHEIARQTFLHNSSYQKEWNWKYPNYGAFPCCRSNTNQWMLYCKSQPSSRGQFSVIYPLMACELTRISPLLILILIHTLSCSSPLSLPHLGHCTWLGVGAGLLWLSLGNFAAITAC